MTMTFRNKAHHRILSGILALVMVFTIAVELIQPVSAAAPTLQLKKISNIYDGSIYVTGMVKCSRADKISAYGLLYGENSPEENKAVISSAKTNTFTGTRSISTTVSGMTPGKNYVCCLYAETTDGTLYKSEAMTFTSSSISVAQLETKNITHNSAQISAMYTRTGSCPVKEVGFYYGTDQNCMTNVKASKSTKFNARLQSLEAGQTYYYYAYVISASGNVYKSEIQTFRTLSRSATGVTLRTGVGAVSSWKGNPKEKSVYLYDEFRMEAEIRPDYTENKNVTFSTSDPTVLQIENDWAKAVAPGKATLTAVTEDGGITASLLITVKEEPCWDEVPVITSVRATGEDSASLMWKRPNYFDSKDKVIYIVYRSSSRNGSYEEVERTTRTSTTDDTLDPGTTYFYKIQSYEKSADLYQYTYFSDPVSVTTKEHIYVPKSKDDKTPKNDNVIEPDPVEVTSAPGAGSSIIAPDPVPSAVPAVSGACSHQNYDDVYVRTEYTDIILTDTRHTSYEVYDRTCLDCTTHLGEVNTETETTGHTVKKEGYCDCGYMNVSGYTPEKAYNKTGSTQNIYRNPQSSSWYGSINANENVTILGEWGDRYLIEYYLDGGGLKQGWVERHCIEKKTVASEKTETPAEVETTFFDINVIEEKSTGNTITFALSQLYPSDMDHQIIHIPFQGMDTAEKQEIEFGIKDQVLGTFYPKEGENAAYCEVSKSEIIDALGVMGGGDGSGLASAVLNNDGHVWWRCRDSGTRHKYYFWYTCGELYFSYNVVTGKFSWEKDYENNGEVKDITFDIAFLLMDAFSFQKQVVEAAIKNVAEAIGKETIEYTGKEVLKHFAKEYGKEFLKALGEELVDMTIDEIKGCIEEQCLDVFIAEYEGIKDKNLLINHIINNKNYQQFLEDYAVYGVPRGISLEMFTQEVAALVKLANDSGQTTFSLTGYGPTVEVEKGVYLKYYTSVE